LWLEGVAAVAAKGAAVTTAAVTFLRPTTVKL
jgi:hypothetical protein